MATVTRSTDTAVIREHLMVGRRPCLSQRPAVCAIGQSFAACRFVLGQANEFCAAEAGGAVHFAVSAGHIRGEIQVGGGSTGSISTLELERWPNYYTLPARLTDIAGQYQEEAAEFANEDTVINADRSGEVVLSESTLRMCRQRYVGPSP